MKKTKTMEDFFAEFDEDYDGFLTPREFYEAIMRVGSDISV